MKKCKYLYDEVCVNDECPYVADFPPYWEGYCYSKKQCDYYTNPDEKEK